MINTKVKHIDIRYQFIIDEFFEKKVELVKIDGKFNSIIALMKVIFLNIYKKLYATMQKLHEHNRFY